MQFLRMVTCTKSTYPCTECNCVRPYCSSCRPRWHPGYEVSAVVPYMRMWQGHILGWYHSLPLLPPAFLSLPTILPPPPPLPPLVSLIRAGLAETYTGTQMAPNKGMSSRYTHTLMLPLLPLPSPPLPFPPLLWYMYMLRIVHYNWRKNKERRKN